MAIKDKYVKLDFFYTIYIFDLKKTAKFCMSAHCFATWKASTALCCVRSVYTLQAFLWQQPLLFPFSRWEWSIVSSRALSFIREGLFCSLCRNSWRCHSLWGNHICLTDKHINVLVIWKQLWAIHFWTPRVHVLFYWKSNMTYAAQFQGEMYETEYKHYIYVGLLTRCSCFPK